MFSTFFCNYRKTEYFLGGLQVIVAAGTGEKPTTAQFIGRYLAYYISILPLFLGLIWVGIDKRKQGWHDKLAGTVVLRNKKPEPVMFEG